jgi:TOMM system kinase/cyclase fusion protein
MTHSTDDQLLSVNVLQEKYRFIKKLGKGGFSDVFLAEQRNSGEHVAVKMIKAETTGTELDRKAARFRREMLLYGKLNHPNIVKVIDSGETDNGILFITFEYIKGITLADLLKQEGSLSLARTMHLMKQVLHGLNEAHSQGIIHRDLKPENIMIAADDTSGQVKILDFGISTFIQKLSDDSTRLTMTREFLGTPCYSAPEQLRGEAVSVKVDTYAWGLIFLECITGRSPFSGQTIPAIVQQQLTPSPIPLPAAIINHQLGTLLRWVLEKDAARRAGNVTIIASHLETVSIETMPQSNGFLTNTLTAEESDSTRVMIYETVSAPPERRQITVFCCAIDMQMTQSGMSNEVMDEIYQDLMESAGNLTKRFGAYTASDSGDRIFAYFGFPDAGDTDARRAARCALELANVFTQRNAVFSKQHGITVSFRIGINTGTITVRKHSHNVPTLSGFVLNYAGKLCRVAQPNTILVSKSSFLLLNHTIELQENNSGFGDELLSDNNVYTLTGEKRSDSLIDIFNDTMSPMIGRDGELARLYDLWTTIRSNSIGKAILLQGEAGIGKSRLSAEFAKKISEEHGAWIECRCLPEGKNSALHPILSFLRNQFRLSESSSQKDNSSSLERHLNQFGIDCSIAMPIFGSWLGVSVEGYTMPQFSPQKQKDIVLQLSSEILARTAQDSGSIIMVEDLHWADPTTIEFLPKLFEQVKKRGVMLCMTARPVFVPSWNSSDADVVSLSGLNDEYVEEIVKAIFGTEEIGRETLAKIVSRVDGVPLFIEEIAKLIRENKLNKENIPLTLRDLLNSKIDLLGPARETAQLASVIGREFDYNLIEKVSHKDAASLLADLDHLISAGIIHLQLVVGNPHYVFHHALVRDAAYEGIDKRVRKEMHARIAEVLEREFNKEKETSPELLAWHWAEAQNYLNAVTYGINASAQYLIKSLYIEALSHATSCNEWVKNIIDISVKTKMELQILQMLIPLYISTKGFAAPEVEFVNNRLDELRDYINNDSNVLSSILWGKVIYYETTPDYKKMESSMEEAFNVATNQNNMDLLSVLYTVRSHYKWSHGLFKDSISDTDNALLCYKNRILNNQGTVFGFDAKVLSLGIKALLLNAYGDHYTSSENIFQSIDYATVINDPSSKAVAYVYHLCILHGRNEKESVNKYGNEYLKFIEHYGLGLYQYIVELFIGWVNKDINKLMKSLHLVQSTGSRQLESYWNFIIAQTEYELGLFNDSLKRIEKNIVQGIESGEIYYLPELYRLKALCLINNDIDNKTETETSFINAIKSADTIDAHLFKLRALLNYHHYLPEQWIKKDCWNILQSELNLFTKFNNYQDIFEVKEFSKLNLM